MDWNLLPVCRMYPPVTFGVGLIVGLSAELRAGESTEQQIGGGHFMPLSLVTSVS
jgi:hypothetical protein